MAKKQVEIIKPTLDDIVERKNPMRDYIGMTGVLVTLTNWEHKVTLTKRGGVDSYHFTFKTNDEGVNLYYRTENLSFIAHWLEVGKSYKSSLKSMVNHEFTVDVYESTEGFVNLKNIRLVK